MATDGGLIIWATLGSNHLGESSGVYNTITMNNTYFTFYDTITMINTYFNFYNTITTNNNYFTFYDTNLATQFSGKRC